MSEIGSFALEMTLFNQKPKPLMQTLKSTPHIKPALLTFKHDAVSTRLSCHNHHERCYHVLIVNGGHHTDTINDGIDLLISQIDPPLEVFTSSLLQVMVSAELIVGALCQLPRHLSSVITGCC